MELGPIISPLDTAAAAALRLLRSLLPAACSASFRTRFARSARALDCLLPCGPRSWPRLRRHCGSGVSCTSGCPSCTGGVPVSNPFQDDELRLPSLPSRRRRKPAIRKASWPRAPVAAAASSRSAYQQYPAHDVSERTQRVSDEVSQANHIAPVVKKPAATVKRTSSPVLDRQPAARSSIPHNPLR